MLMSQELTSKIIEICKELENVPWNKSGIFADPPVINVYVGIETYNDFQNNPNHPLRLLIDESTM
jgi:hypothetical protein